jgi:hypothetical protein
VTSNSINNSEESGIWMDGTSNTVSKNKIEEAPIGIHAACGNTVAVTGSTKNTFLNVPQPTDLETCLGSISSLGSARANASPAK